MLQMGIIIAAMVSDDKENQRKFFSKVEKFPHDKNQSWILEVSLSRKL